MNETNSSAAISISTTTSTRLLESLHDSGNHTVWGAFVDRYRPLMLRYMRRIGLRNDDAEDVTQAALLAFLTAYREGKYDREKGRLRSWLFGIARRQVMSWRRSRNRRQVRASDDIEATRGLPRAGTRDATRTVRDERSDCAALHRCLRQVRREVGSKTFRAFELFAVEGLPAGRVARRLGTSRNAVYCAKRRILLRLRELADR